MCFSSDQHPPLLPRFSDVARHEPTELTAADGTRLSAYEAVPQTRRGASLVLLPDIRGLHPYYTDLAICFAQAGIDTVAIDPYARSAGLVGPAGGRDPDFDPMPHAKALDRSSVLTDARAARDRLAERRDHPVFTLGFCKFGAESWALSATDLGAAGCMGFYGIVAAVMDLVPAMRSPLLVLAAGADRATTPEQNATFDRALTEAGVDHEFVEYAGAPHSFFDRSFEQWQEACEDAWRRMLAFVDARR